MSQYKIRTLRRKKNYAPYQTKKEQGIVSRMWGWLTPSWWATTDPSPPPSPPPGPSHDQSHDQPPLSCDHTSSVVMEAETSSGKSALVVTEPCVPLDPLPDMEQRPVMNGMGPDDDSSTSWIAEDVDTQGTSGWAMQQAGLSGGNTDLTRISQDPGSREHCVKKIQNPAFGTVPNHALTPSLFSSERRHGSGFTSRVLRTRPLSTSTPQLSPVNEADEQGKLRGKEPAAQHHSSHDGHHGNRMGSRMTHTPSSGLPSIPEQTPCHAIKSVFHTTPSTSSTVATRAQRYTDLSLSRSPFQSPFYSGRTSYGGAASGQRLRTVKRARTESSPPMLATVQLTVTAKPHPSAPPTSLPLSSSTARKILHTLDSLSSPLADARKLPLRAAGFTDRQPARKRHKSAHSALSPPPIATLSTPTLNAPLVTPALPPGGPVIVPNEKSLRRKQASSGQSVLLGATLHPEKQDACASPPAVASGCSLSKGQSSSLMSTQSSPQPSTAPQPPTSSFSPLFPASSSARLSSITFSAPPFPSQHVSPDHSKQQSTSPARMASKPVPNFMPTFHAINSSPLATSGGKMRLPRSSRTHHSHHHDNPDEEEVPVSKVPQVGLKLSGNNSPSFNFTHTIMTFKPASTTVAQATETPPNYSFSTPKLLTSQSSVQTPPKQISTSFQFSLPKPCTPSKTHHQAQATSPHPPAITTRKQATPTNQEAPPLKSISVVDILKRPDYQSLTAGKVPSSVKHPIQPAESAVVDLTEECEEQGKEKTAETNSGGGESKVAVKFPSFLSSGFQPTPTSSLPSTSLLQTHVQLQTSTAAVTIQPPSTAAVSVSPSARAISTASAQSSSTKPLTGFSVPAGSWECSTCLVQNSSSQEKCVACATAQPAANQLTTPPPLTSSAAVSKLTPLPQFSTPKDSWECATCLVPNSASQSKCVACATPKPGGVATGNLAMNKTAVQPPVIQFGSQGGLQLGSGGLQFGKAAPGSTGSEGFTLAPAGQSDSTRALPTTAPPLQPLAQFAPPEGSWSCDTCMVSNKKTDSKCIACGTPKSGDPASTTSDRPPVTSATAPIMFGTGGGLKLGAGGLKLGTVGQGMKSQGSDEGGLKFGSGGLKIGDGGLQFGSKGGLAVGNSLQKSSQNEQRPSGPLQITLSGGWHPEEWECSTCLVTNKSAAPVCVACGGTKPGQEANAAPGGIQGGGGTGMQTIGSCSGTGMGLKLTAGPLGTFTPQQSNPLSGLKFSTPAGTSLPLSTAKQPSVAPSVTFSTTSSVPSVAQSPLLPAPTQPSLGAASSSLISQSTSPASTVIFPTGGLSSTATTNTFSSMFTSAPAPSLVFGAPPLTSSSGFSFKPATTSSSTQPPLFQFGQSTHTSSAGLTFGTATTSSAGLRFGAPSTTSFTGFNSGTATTSSAGFTFGAVTSRSTGASTFTFSGANPSTGQTSHVGFGTTEQSRQSSSTGFNFSGANSNTAQTSQTGFNFGAASKAVPSFNFGAGPTPSTGLSSGAPLSAPGFQLPAGQTGMFTGGVAPPSTTGRVIRRARRRK